MLDNQAVALELKRQFLELYSQEPRRPDLSDARVIVHVAQDGLTIKKIAVRLGEGLDGERDVRHYGVEAP